MWKYDIIYVMNWIIKGRRILIHLFKREHLELIKAYQKKLLKYIIAIQLNLLIAAGCILFVVVVVTESTLDKLFNHSCVEFIVNSTRLQICPSMFMSDIRSATSLASSSLSSAASFFSWKNDIMDRMVFTFY